MIKFQKKELVAGMILLCSGTQNGLAREFEPLEMDEDALNSEAGLDANGPSILDVMIRDGEGVTPPTPVNGGYLVGIVLRQYIRANWLQSEVGLQLFHEGEKLDPRRYEVEWKILSSSSPVVKARFAPASGIDYGQKLEIVTPMTLMHARVLGTIEIEARITDREDPEKAPVIVVQTLGELLGNGRDGL